MKKRRAKNGRARIDMNEYVLDSDVSVFVYRIFEDNL